MCRIKNLLILKNFGIINKHNQSKKQQHYFKSIRDNYQESGEI